MKRAKYEYTGEKEAKPVVDYLNRLNEIRKAKEELNRLIKQYPELADDFVKQVKRRDRHVLIESIRQHRLELQETKRAIRLLEQELKDNRRGIIRRQP